MAELGHPVLGPQSFYKLTPGEIRIYAEGMEHRNERRKDREAYDSPSAGTGMSTGPRYNRESKKKRDQQALQKVEQRAQEQYS